MAIAVQQQKIQPDQLAKDNEQQQSDKAMDTDDDDDCSKIKSVKDGSVDTHKENGTTVEEQSHKLV